jgi:phosphatidylglycerol lysyltransferase
MVPITLQTSADQLKTRILSGRGRKILIAAILFIGAVLVLRHGLRNYDYADIARAIETIPKQNLIWALLLTAINYLVLTCYDALAFRYIHKTLPYKKVAFASFVGYAFSQSLGLPLITGGSVRYRLYSRWGCSAAEIARITAFSALTFWMGILTVGGIAMLADPVAVPANIHMPLATQTIGILLLSSVIFYCGVAAFRKGPERFLRWKIVYPSLELSLAQVVISSIDWLLAAGVLYALLPSGNIPLAHFCAIFVTAQIVGLISNVPGGLGVFESIFLLLLSPRISPADLIGSLLAYRGIYYLLPLAISFLMLAVHELAPVRRRFLRSIRIIQRYSRQFAPTGFAVAVFAAGVILIFSVATPSVPQRLKWVSELLPLPLVEFSHLLASFAGIALLLLARGLQRRLDAAYIFTAILLFLGAVASFFKGFDYEEMILLLLLLAALVRSRSIFSRKASLTADPFTWPWTVSILLVLLSAVWLTLFSYKQVPYSHELWLQFDFSGEAPRSLRAIFVVIGLAFIFGIRQMLRPASVEPALPNVAELKVAHEIIQQTSYSPANLALLGDKSLLFSKSQKSFLMYGVEKRSWIALGDPVGLDSEKAELAWRFREISNNHNGWTVFYEVGSQSLPLYLELGLTLTKIGEEATVPLEEFTLDGASRKTFRHLLNKFQRDGYSFEIVPVSQVPELMPELQNISDAWLNEKRTREKGFSLGYFHLPYLEYFPAGIVKHNGQILAFANIWLSATKEELSLDLMRFLPEAPNGVMDYLFLNLMMWGKKEGYKKFNLGMAPFSGLADRHLAPITTRLGALVYRRGENFYNFKGLRQYKEKFDPVWEPRYLASPGGLALPRVLANVAALVSSGLRGVISK